MSNYNKIFHKVPVEVQNRSGFNKSHQNTFTAKVGTLMPVLVDDVLPNTKVRLNLGAEIQLPPMATDFYGRVRGKFEAFFVPFRLLYGGWQELITHQDDSSGYPTNSNMFQKANVLPGVELSADDVKAGSLADMLGFKHGYNDPDMSIKVNNILPFLAYHKIWDDWYRDSRIQKSCFERAPYQFNSQNYPSGLPYQTIYEDYKYMYSGNYRNMSDGVKVTSLRQRNWQRDYFTNATPAPQMGTVSKIVFNTEGTTGEFTMPQLFAANALQKWAQVNNLAGNRYADQIKAHFGILPSDAILDRAIYLGSKTVDVYNKSVYTTAESDTSGTGNPFGSPASKFANSIGVSSLGGANVINDFTATEHGFVFVMFSLVPDAVYSTGVRKYLQKDKMSDFAFPELSHMGDQPITKEELIGYDTDHGSETFGYTQRYSEYKYMIDEVHGLMRDGESLETFTLQRSFGGNDTSNIPDLSTSFLEIPTDYLDQVSAVRGDIGKYGCWCVTHFDYKIAAPLPAYSIPTLGDLKDTHTEIIDNGGRRL